MPTMNQQRLRHCDDALNSHLLGTNFRGTGENAAKWVLCAVCTFRASRFHIDIYVRREYFTWVLMLQIQRFNVECSVQCCASLNPEKERVKFIFWYLLKNTNGRRIELKGCRRLVIKYSNRWVSAPSCSSTTKLSYFVRSRSIVIYLLLRKSICEMIITQ